MEKTFEQRVRDKLEGASAKESHLSEILSLLGLVISVVAYWSLRPGLTADQLLILNTGFLGALISIIAIKSERKT
jgi:hypothetical protein